MNRARGAGAKFLRTASFFFPKLFNEPRLLHINNYNCQMATKSLKRTRESRDADAGSDVKRPRREEDLKLSKFYEDLTAESDETRLEAAKQILVKFDWDNEPSAEAVQKAIKRLIRGLCSQRKAARFGFFVTLTELQRQIFGQEEKSIPGLDYNTLDIVKLVEEGTKVEGNVPGVVRAIHSIIRLKLTELDSKDEITSSAGCLDTSLYYNPGPFSYQMMRCCLPGIKFLIVFIH